VRSRIGTAKYFEFRCIGRSQEASLFVLARIPPAHSTL
jgi:hypothetical protein